jgi:hypothetical protein
MHYVRTANYESNLSRNQPLFTEPCKVYNKDGELTRIIEPQLNKHRYKSKNLYPVQEKDIVKQIVDSLGVRYELETSCKHGRVDILTDKLIIEVKEVSNYKEGIGQLKSYNSVFKSKRCLIYLFERNNNFIDKYTFDKIFEVCREQKIFTFTHSNSQKRFNDFLEKYKLK